MNKVSKLRSDSSIPAVSSSGKVNVCGAHGMTDNRVGVQEQASEQGNGVAGGANERAREQARKQGS